MTRYLETLDRQFPAAFKRLLGRVSLLENRLAAFGTNADGTISINNLVTVNHIGGQTLIYNGTPALGTLLMSISGAAGVDDFGNAYPQGIGVWDLSGNPIGQWGAGGLSAALKSIAPGSPPGTADVWHGPTLAAGFAPTGIPYAPVGYQYEGVNGGRVRLRGRLDLTANQAVNTVIFTVDPDWAPAHTQEFTAAGTISGATNQVPVIGVAASGNVTLLDAGTSGDSVRLDGLVYTLD